MSRLHSCLSPALGLSRMCKGLFCVFAWPSVVLSYSTAEQPILIMRILFVLSQPLTASHTLRPFGIRDTHSFYYTCDVKVSAAVKYDLVGIKPALKVRCSGGGVESHTRDHTPQPWFLFLSFFSFFLNSHWPHVFGPKLSQTWLMFWPRWLRFLCVMISWGARKSLCVAQDTKVEGLTCWVVDLDKTWGEGIKNQAGLKRVEWTV